MVESIQQDFLICQVGGAPFAVSHRQNHTLLYSLNPNKSRMQIEVASQRMLLLKDQLSPEQAKEKAWQKKVSAFDAVSKVTSFLSKPKDEDFTLTYSEHR